MILGPIADAAAARSPVHGRVVFLATSDEGRARRAIAALGARPGVATRPRGSGLLVRGVPRVVGNFLMGQGEGYSALIDEQPFLGALRRLTDEPLVALLEQTGGATAVDWSPGIEQPPNDEIARALYPDATFLDDAALTALIDDAEGAEGAAPTPLPPVAATHPVGDGSPFTGRVLFVLGAPRSGTTWLAGLLLTHPGAAGLPEGETWVFQALRDLWANDDLNAWLHRDRIVAAVRRFLDDVFAAHRDTTRPEATLFVEKTPAHVFRIAEMAAVYPDAAYVHIVRDGRDVARSLAEMEHGPGDIAVAARYWAESIATVRRDARLLGRFREVRYEELVADPVGGVADILSWAGMPVDAGTTEALAARAGVRVSRHGTNGPVGPGKWQAMSKRDLATVEREAGTVLAELGYTTPRRRLLRR